MLDERKLAEYRWWVAGTVESLDSDKIPNWKISNISFAWGADEKETTDVMRDLHYKAGKIYWARKPVTMSQET